jgi:uncharacterized phiE125 gp8 family phage protein
MMLPAATLKTPPTFEVVTLADAKAQVRVSHDYEDALIAGYVVAARQWVEAYTGRALCPQTWQLSMHRFPLRVWLPRAAPLASVTFVKYYDAANTLTTLSASTYTVPAFNEPAVIERAYAATWPTIYDRRDAVQMEYVAGYAQGECPQSLVQAVQLLTAHCYENREAILSPGDQGKEAPFAVTALCSPYRVWWRGPEW